MFSFSRSNDPTYSTNTDPHASDRMVLPLWRSLHSLNLMLPKEDRKAMLLRLYNEDTPLMDHSKDRFHANADAKARSNTNTHTDAKDEAEEEEEVEKVEEEDGTTIADASLDGDVEMNRGGNEEVGEKG